MAFRSRGRQWKRRSPLQGMESTGEALLRQRAAFHVAGGADGGHRLGVTAGGGVATTGHGDGRPLQSRPWSMYATHCIDGLLLICLPSATPMPSLLCGCRLLSHSTEHLPHLSACNCSDLRSPPPLLLLNPLSKEQARPLRVRERRRKEGAGEVVGSAWFKDRGRGCATRLQDAISPLAASQAHVGYYEVPHGGQRISPVGGWY